MAEYVSREAALDAMQGRIKLSGECLPFFKEYLQGVNDRINAIPSANVVERKQGMWIDVNLNFLYKCSECGRLHDELTNYCPYCGTEMRGQNRRSPE